ncbi:MAG: hypothetical protein HQ488_04675 [Parcubacteria group bacterium]|nr:hypothetical protein [Parcubacteria group bacterium]
MNPKAWFTPNQPLSPAGFWLWSIIWIAVFILTWELWRSPTVPGVSDTLSALMGLMGKQSFYLDIMESLKLTTMALGLATVISLLLSYARSLGFVQPLVRGVTLMRFLSIAGLSFIARQMFVSGDGVKLSLLTFAITVFFTTSMVAVVMAIPQSKYDYARTLRMSEWEIVKEIVVFGTFADALEAMRQNNAIGFAMLAGVEVISRSGGLGVIMYDAKKYTDPGVQTAIMLLVLVMGIGIDYLLGLAKRVCAPHTALGGH